MKFFDQKVKINGPKKSKFDLSHERKFSFNMGELIPILCQDVMPGDNFRVSTEQMMRLAPMIAPMMHRVNVYMHYFFVPNRLVWDQWEEFITGGAVGSVPPVFPTVKVGLNTGTGPITPGLGSWWNEGGLADYMGVPTWTNPGTADALNPKEISALPFRAYQLIYQEYFRDEDLSPVAPPQRGSGPTPAGSYTGIMGIQMRSWEKDYGTSARPWAQKGGSVGIPFTYKDQTEVHMSGPGSGFSPTGNTLSINNVVPGILETNLAGVPTAGARIENIEALASINELREANALQRFLEKLARAGNRYIEYIKVIFGETSSDSRLQRPEYLGGGRSPIVISEVLSTFDDTAGGNPQGTMSGHGIAVGNTSGFSRSFNEHGYVIGLISVLPRTGYQQGLDKHFSRFDQFDFPIPDFAHLGEQEVKNKEIYLDVNEAVDENEATFGYQSRYAECKFKNNTSHGDFRTNLAFWHMDRIFATRPHLNSAYVASDPTTRIFAITDPNQDHLWCQLHHSISAIRPLPYHGTAAL